MLSPGIERRAAALAHADLPLPRVFQAFDQLLRETIPYAVAVWGTQDPSTGLFTSCTMTGFDKDPAREAVMFAYEFRDDEPATFRSLIRDGRTVVVLSEATGGDLYRAGRYRDLLASFGVTDEMRSVLSVDGTPGGACH